jgi:predicted RNA methylase
VVVTTTKGINSPVRQKNEFYETPAWATYAMLNELNRVWPRFFSQWPRSILDPGAGSGAITDALKRVYPEARLVAVEIEERHRENLLRITGKVYITNYLLAPVSRFGDDRFDLIFGNPPYSGPKRRDLAMEFVQHSLRGAAVVCMLTRLNWLGSKRRAQFMRENPPYVCILPKRPSFVAGKGTDTAEYAWMTWGMKGLQGTWKVLEI